MTFCSLLCKTVMGTLLKAIDGFVTETIWIETGCDVSELVASERRAETAAELFVAAAIVIVREPI